MWISEGKEAVVSGSGGVITSVKTYNLADSFTWSVDYSIANNYNCYESDYTAVSVGDLSLRISSSRNFEAGGRNESFTSNKPYETGFSLYWQDKLLTADYSYNCFFTTIYVTYKMEYNKGDGFILPATVTGLKDYEWDGNYKKLDRLVTDIIESYNELVENTSKIH